MPISKSFIFFIPRVLHIKHLICIAVAAEVNIFIKFILIFFAPSGQLVYKGYAAAEKIIAVFMEIGGLKVFYHMFFMVEREYYKTCAEVFIELCVGVHIFADLPH